MASLTCVCGQLVSQKQAVCQCGLPRPRGGWAPALPGSPPDLPAPPPTTPVDVPTLVADCSHETARPGAVTCPSCGSVLAAESGYVIQFPWGEHRVVPGDELPLGRETGPLRAQTRAYSTVGRRHAILRCTLRGGLLLVDEGSTNGTYVNGERIPSHTPVEVHTGDRIALSTRLLLVVGDE